MYGAVLYCNTCAKVVKCRIMLLKGWYTGMHSPPFSPTQNPKFQFFHLLSSANTGIYFGAMIGKYDR